MTPQSPHIFPLIVYTRMPYADKYYSDYFQIEMNMIVYMFFYRYSIFLQIVFFKTLDFIFIDQEIFQI